MSTATPSKIAAIAQLTSTNSKLSNLLNVARCASQANANGASMLFLPECFGFMGSSTAETIENAEDLHDTERTNTATVAALLESMVKGKSVLPPSSTTKTENQEISIMDGLRTIARVSNLWISGGGIHETIGEKVYNTHIILDNKGDLLQKYRKVHLFDVSIPGRVELKESNTTQAGDSLHVCQSPVGMLGLTTCYDVRFPEQYTELVKRGAQVILVPSAFTVPTGSAHWHILLRARAIETQCYVLAAAQVGIHNEKRESYGHSLAIDPWGEVVADAALEPGPTIVTCQIDLDKLADIRLRMPIQQHRKAAECVPGLR